MSRVTPHELRALANRTWTDSSQHRPVYPLEHSLQRTATALRAAADQIERLESAIDAAPHDGANNRKFCSSLWRYPDQHADPCDCWKADAP